MSEFATVAKVGDIPEGEGRAFEYKDQVVAVFNDGGTYYAIDDMCPHMGASLATGHFENNVVSCPWHGWSFDTRDGAWCDNRRIKIDTFDVRLVDGDIQVAAKPKVESAEETQKDAEKTNEESNDSDKDQSTEGQSE